MDAIDLPPTHQIQRLKADPRFQVKSAPQPGMPWGWPMNTKRAPTTDLKVREAMIYASTAKAGAERAPGRLQARLCLTPATFAYNPAVEKMYPYDPARRRRSWTRRAGRRAPDGMRAKDGVPLVIEHYVFYTTAEAEFVQADLRKVGIKTNTLCRRSAPSTRSPPRASRTTWRRCRSPRSIPS